MTITMNPSICIVLIKVSIYCFLETEQLLELKQLYYGIFIIMKKQQSAVLLQEDNKMKIIF